MVKSPTRAEPKREEKADISQHRNMMMKKMLAQVFGAQLRERERKNNKVIKTRRRKNFFRILQIILMIIEMKEDAIEGFLSNFDDF